MSNPQKIPCYITKIIFKRIKDILLIGRGKSCQKKPAEQRVKS